MKKIGVLVELFMLGVVILLLAGFGDAVADLHVQSWRADNISGYACSDPEQPPTATIQFYDQDIQPEDLIISLNYDPNRNSEVCSGKKYSWFFINLFKINSQDLDRILKNYPFNKMDVDMGFGGLNTRQTSPVLDFSCSNENQTIMKLWQPANAHVYAWNTIIKNNDEELYPICYERIFGYEYAGLLPAHPNSCLPDTTILWKHQGENSHVATFNLDGEYPQQVCYGDLKCSFQINDCIGKNNLTIRLYYQNNSHVSDGFDTDYTIKMCCNTSYVPNPIREAKWKNMFNQEIGQANITDYVKLSLNGMNLKNMLINYTIYDSSSNQIVFFRINTSQYDSPSIVWEAMPNAIYKFNALVYDESNNNLNSSNIQIENKCSQDEFKIQFVQPKCGNNFTIDMNINFTINITTSNRLVIGNISFDDGTYENFTNEISNLIEFSHNFNFDGTKKVIVQASSVPISESYCPERVPVSRKKMINLIIINESKSGIYTAACIDSPEEADHIKTQKVNCTGFSTRAINYAADQRKYNFIDSSLLYFKWAFSDNTIHEFIGVLNTTQNSPCYNKYDVQHNYTNPLGELYSHMISCESTTNGTSFTKYFQSAGDHQVDLIVKFNE